MSVFADEEREYLVSGVRLSPTCELAGASSVRPASRLPGGQVAPGRAGAGEPHVSLDRPRPADNLLTAAALPGP